MPTLPAGSPSPTPRRAWKWTIAIVLFLATVLTYLDRQTMALCGSMIGDEFHLTNEQYGQLQAAFRGAYACTHLLAGALADHLPIRLVYALAVTLWSAAGAAAAFTTGFHGLWATRAVLGVGESFNWPCATRIVANRFSPADRGLASGIFNSGSAVAMLLGPVTIMPLAVQFGWRVAFLVIGAVGLVWLLLWHFTAQQAVPVEHAQPVVAELPWDKQRLAALAMLLLPAVMLNPCWYFLAEWIPKYLHDQHGLGYLWAGLLSVPIFLGADLGSLASGGAIKWLVGRGWPLGRARATVLTLCATLALPMAAIGWLNRSTAVLIPLGLAGMGIAAIVANFTACQQDFSYARAGLVTGLVGTLSNAVSATVNPLIGRYVDGSGQYTLIFLLVAVFPAVSVVALAAFDRLNRTSAT